MRRSTLVHLAGALAVGAALFAAWPLLAELHTRWLLAVEWVAHHRWWLPVDLGRRENLRFLIPALALILAAPGAPVARRLHFAAGLVAVMVALDTLVVASGLAGLLGGKPDPRHALLGAVATALVFHTLDFALPVAALMAFFGAGRAAPPEVVASADTDADAEAA